MKRSTRFARRTGHLGGVVVLWVAVALAACGDDGASDGPEAGSAGDGDAPNLGVNTGVDGDIAATEATANQAAAICQAFEDAIDGDAEIESDCTREAVLETESEADCVAFRDQCIASEQDSSDSDDSCHGDSIQAGLSTCRAGVTLGDIEDCLNEYFGLGTTVTCADAGRVPPPACFEKLLSDCPDLFGDDDDDDGNHGDGDGDGDAGDGDGGSCPRDASAGASVDCDAFCDALLAPGCDNGPSDMDECLFVCQGTKDTCGGVIGALDACQRDGARAWMCEPEGDPDLPGCGPELLCLGDCVDALLAE